MRMRISMAVVIPAGPQDDILDTLSSVVHYTEKSRIVVVINDNSPFLKDVASIKQLSTDIVLLDAPTGAPGTLGGLWVKLACGYRWILERYEPQVILRLDADALVIGSGLESRASQTFAGCSKIGLLGSYRIGPDGGGRDYSWAAQRLRAETGIRGLRHPRIRAYLRSHLSLARTYDYVDGESALGGAYLHSFGAANRIYLNGWFDQPWLASSKLGEDHIMALLTYAAGYRIADFGGPEDPLALKWKGLPAHPEELLAKRKLVTHSVRSWGNLSEEEIRRIFKEARTYG